MQNYAYQDQQFLGLISSSAAPFIVSDTEGVIRYANRAKAFQTGFDVPEIIGKKPGKLWGGNMSVEFYQNLWKRINTERKSFSSKITNSKKNGAQYSENIVIRPIIDNSLNISYFVGYSPKAISISQALDRSNAWLLIRDTLVLPTQERFTDRSEDERLVKMSQQDATQFSLLYEKYYNTIYSYLSYRLGGDDNLSDDLAQETFTKAFQHIDSFSVTNASYGTYLIRIAHNLLVNHFRGQKNNLQLDAAESLPDISASFDRYHAKNAVETASWALSEIEKSALKMKYIDGYSIREISTYLQKSENAIKLHLSRARKKLQREID